MTTHPKYVNNYVAIKYMLSSYRALSDGKVGIEHLQKTLENSSFLFSEWKIIWTGTCATLRTAIDLFKLDSKICISEDLAKSFKEEWNSIKLDEKSHPIFWEFLRKERDNIVHEYKWTAFEQWLNPDGELENPPTILGRLMLKGESKTVLIMKDGYYKSQDSLDLLKSAADWIEERIFACVHRAGLNPDERRSVWNFAAEPPPTSRPNYSGVMALLAESAQADALEKAKGRDD